MSREGRAFRVPVPARGYHGTGDPDTATYACRPANESSLFTEVGWEDHDSWMDGGPHLEDGIPYANVVWEALGLRDGVDVPGWAADLRSLEELGREVGLLFFTDDEQVARSRYGDVLEVDLEADQVLEVIEDPHTRTHRAWIALVKVGEPLPFLDVVALPRP